MTFHLQHDLRQTPLEAGMAMTAWPLATAAAAVVAGRAADRIASAWLCAAGGGLLATGLAAAALLPAGVTGGAMGAMALCGVGFGLFQTPNNRTLYLAAPAHRTGAAGGMQGTARLAGQTAGALGLTALFSLSPGGEAARVGLLLAAVPALAGAAISLTRGRLPR
jgi:DHA2 family multidrug resistance protein-like MFS transporter